MGLTIAQRLKFQLLEHGIGLSQETRDTIREASRDQALSSHDFASTSGMILRLEDNVWVNAPIRDHNPNFVTDECPFILQIDENGLIVRGANMESRAHYWLQPRFHGESTFEGQPLTNYVVTHGDRARLSPLHGCSMVCKFCDVPYGMRYQKKDLDMMIDAVSRALHDPIQPARHLLISGGTPIDQDIQWLKTVYQTVLTTFPDLDVDIMMVPTGNLIDVDELKDQGVSQLSINLELYSDDAARRMMPKKFKQGRSHYLDFIERAAQTLGPGRVRSMLMVGLEPMEETLAGVVAIAERGGVPVLSPFRPDPATPLRDIVPPKAAFLETVFDRATERLAGMASTLGPQCPPCTHNTLSFAPVAGDDQQHSRLMSAKMECHATC